MLLIGRCDLREMVKEIDCVGEGVVNKGFKRMVMVLDWLMCLQPGPSNG